MAEQGFSVATTDISSGASLRALERSRRFGFPLRVVVADAERLPFPNRSFDLVYVHDGLHHLEQPYVGLDEMLRVARSAVSINEPAAAAVTRAAAVIGVAENVEEAGNHVKRMSLDAIQARCDEAGFDVVQARRYAMFYRHEPGLPMRVLSKPILFTAARVGSSVVNRFVGRIGNKLTVQAVRRA
ncbi:MAG: class I SAM-dependent methyltransferase [Gaiellaceae bacterium MAG52_C11]|nr:class I SAM-dependent methyltransferase [Candidatus Gaiellasilicea maunaloa]